MIGEATGQDIPVMGSLAGRDAGALLHGLRSYPEPERDEELAGWLAGRDQGRRRPRSRPCSARRAR